jgi:pilus assembly protein CpaF
MFTVIVTEKGGDQKRLDFDKPEITIGRVQGNDIILPKGNVSKRHSRIVLKDGKFIIVDLKSTNGTYVNGRKITSPLVIKDTDKIYIGDFIITVEEPNGAAASPGLGAPPLPSPPGLGASPPPPAAAVRKPPPAPLDEGDELPPADAPAARPPSAPATQRPGTGGQPALGTAGAPATGGPPLPPPPVSAPPPRSTAPPPGGNPPPLAARDPLAARAQAMGTPGTSPPRGEPPAPMPPPAREPASMSAPPPLGASAGGAGAGLAAPPPRRTAAVGAVPPPPAAAPRLVGAGAPAPATSPPEPIAPPPAPAATPAPSARAGEDRALPPIAALPSSAAPAPAPAAPAIVPAAAPAAPPDPKKLKALELQREIHDKLVAQLDLARVPIERLAEESLWQRAESAIVDLVEQMEIPSFVDQDALIKDTLNETLGLGPLEDLLADDQVVAILVNRHDRVMAERAGRLEHSEKSFSSEQALRQVIDRLVAPAGKRADASTAILDLRLPDGARLTAVLAATRGPCLSLRKPRTGVVTMEELTRANVLSKQMADFLGVCVAARKNVIVCGGATGAKHHVLAALAAQVPAGERVVSIEDVAELSLGRDAWIALEGRVGDEHGKGGVSMSELLRAARGLRPDRLVVGELSGGEAYELLLAMSSAHDGTLVGVAAEGARPALGQLETFARLAAGAATTHALRTLVAQAAQVIVHVARYADGAQRVTSITEVSGVRPGETGDYDTRDLFQFQPQGRGPDGVIRGRFAALGIIPRFYETLEARGIAADTSVFK